MIFYGTITIEWNGLGQPLRSMVFRWFWGLATIGNDGLRWFSTIGPTMEWLPTLVEVYLSRKLLLVDPQYTCGSLWDTGNYKDAYFQVWRTSN